MEIHDDTRLQKYEKCKTSRFPYKHDVFLGTCDFKGFGGPWYILYTYCMMFRRTVPHFFRWSQHKKRCWTPPWPRILLGELAILRKKITRCRFSSWFSWCVKWFSKFDCFLDDWWIFCRFRRDVWVAKMWGFRPSVGRPQKRCLQVVCQDFSIFSWPCWQVVHPQPQVGWEEGMMLQWIQLIQ